MPIQVEHLTHVYAPGTPFETKALDDINLTIEDGEFVGLIGHTGSGKSTLIQHLNAIMKPTSGRVLVDGEDISQGVKKSDIRKKVGLVFQYPEYQLFEETVEKDVAFGPKNLGLSEDEIAVRVKEALEMAGLEEEQWKKSPFELSGGQKRRAAIAGVLAMKPKTLILDEPAAGLDPKGRSEMRRMIRSIRASGATILMVSHSMDDVARMCERIIVMNHGKIALDGRPDEVFSEGEKLHEMHLGLPAAAVLRDRLNTRGFQIPANVYTIEQLKEEILKALKKE
ncbi:MAG: energy-coupling factor transporter ATPase [Clostridia bacterium]|nr:energy-coupling factor transporter ATPase [Clostridia bacterium]MBQ4158011.1 energy-coupling factor transporter ATPase [Clostridia bacterium]